MDANDQRGAAAYEPHMGNGAAERLPANAGSTPAPSANERTA